MKLILSFLVMFTFASILYAQENGGPYTADENTVLLMHFDGDATNSASVGNNGIVHGSGVSFEAGIHGQCLRLDNSTFDKQSWIEVPFFDELNFSEEFSIECWFKINSWGEQPTGTRSLFRKDGISWPAEYEVIINASDKSYNANLDCIDDESGAWSANTRSPEIFELNKWYYISMYYNHAHKHVYSIIRDENFQEIYAVRNYSETPPVNSQGKLMIGFGGWSESCFDGWIDELRISNKYRKYRDDVLKDVDINNFKDEVFLPLKDGWTVYQWPLGEFYPIDKVLGEIYRGNSCGPTMLMRTIHYWEYPRYPSGKMEYTMGNIDWYADFDHTEYLWDQIPKTFPSGITEQDYAPAANFSAQVGAASMQSFDYMYCMPKFLKENFHFSEKTRVLFEEEYTKEEWENIFKNELNHGRPIMIGGVSERTATGGSGHYYICNGYNSKNEFFTDYSFNDNYWNKLDDFDYGTSQDIIIFMEPDWGNKSLTLSNPIEDGVYKAGSELDIKWEADNITNLILEYSSDAGYNWQSIANNVDASDGNFKWTIPVDLSDNYKVRISDKENLNVYRKTGKFSVFNQKQFSFTYPNQNSTLAGGLQNPIYWESEGIWAFKLEYSFDGQNWITMSDSIHSKEHFEFDFPDVSEENVLLRATDLSEESLSFQSEAFSLFKDPNNIFQHPVDENTVLLMHFEDNLTNAANNELKPIEGMPIGYYIDNFDQNLGKAFRIDNSDGTPITHNVWVYKSEDLDLGNNWTVEAWVNIKSIGDYKTGFFPIIIEKAESFGIFVYQDFVGNELNGFHGFVNFSNGSKIDFFQREKIELNKWYHIAMISNASSGTVNFFVHDETRNLIYEDSKSFPSASNGEIKQNENLINIGGLGGASNRQFDGFMDEVRISKSSSLFNYLELTELPFLDDFEQEIGDVGEFQKWTLENIEGWHYWHIIPWNGNPGQCMRFQNTDINQNDWLITKAIDCSGAERLSVNFDVFYNGDGVKPKLFYKSLNKEDNSMSNWMELSYSLGPNENEWHSVDEIIIDNPGDIIYVAFQSEFAANQGIYFLLDNFEVKDFTPITYTFSDSSKYFTFYTTLENGENYWNEISDDVDTWYLELCSYWDRPGITPIFNADEKTAIYLLAPDNFAEQSEVELHDWKCGFIQNTNSIVTQLPAGENSLYDNSYPTLVKNTLGQFNLCKHFGNNIADYFKEGFGLFYAGYQTKRDSIVRAVEKLGQQPSLDVFNNLDKFSTTYFKDLAVSKVESSVLSVCGMQNCGGGIPEHWYSHLKYYYIEPDEKRIKLQKRSENFSIYAAYQDIPYLDKIADKLEEKLSFYESTFDTIIQHPFSCVIYPDSQTGDECLIYVSGYNGGSGWSGDKLDVISPLNFYASEADFYNFLIPHEFFHVFHFNLVKYLFELPAFYFEGLANFMAGQGRSDYLDGSEHNIYKIAYAFNHYNYNYKIEPEFENILNSQADDNFNGYYNDPYYFGELFYKYFMGNGVNFPDLKTFFLNNLDYSSIGKNYDNVGNGYMTFLKEYAGLNTSIDILTLPFSDDFENRLKNWSYVNVEGFNNYWETNPDNGYLQSKCAYIAGAIPNEDWLISDIFDTKDFNNLIINFKYKFNGTIPEIYYTTNFDGDISNSTWQKLENVITGNENNWNNAIIEIEEPGNSLVLGIRFKSIDNNYVYLSIDNVSIDGIYTGTYTLQITNSNFKVYPNPISNKSVISFETKTNEKVNLSLYDLQGRKICTLLDEKLNAGTHTIHLGNQIQSKGVYLCKLATSEGISILKLVIN